MQGFYDQFRYLSKRKYLFGENELQNKLVYTTNINLKNC